MKRFIAIVDRRTYTEGRAFWLVLLAAVLVVLLSVMAASGATAYYSLTGTFSDGSETQSFLFNTDAAITSAEPLSLRTWHYSGGTNAAGDVIPGVGFDPILWLYAGETLVAVDDDIDRAVSSYDAELTWRSADYSPPEIALRSPFRTGDYRLDLKALSGGGSHWAVDLVGPADRMTLTGVDKFNNSGTTTIDSLTMGSDDVHDPARLQLGAFQNLSLLQGLSVGMTGSAETTVTNGSITSAFGILGYGVDSIGTMTLSAGGSWSSAGDTTIGGGGEGNLRVESGAIAQVLDSLRISQGGSGNVTVTGNDSILAVNADLWVGSGGAGYLRIEDQGQVNSIGIGGFGDSIGQWIGGQGTVEVDGKDSLWQTDKLIIGNYGQGTVSITVGGKISTTGHAYIGKTVDGYDSSMTLSGTAPDATPSTWQVSGHLYLAADESGQTSAANSKLTINPGGLVDIAGSTIVGPNGGVLELRGGDLKTGALAVQPGATFTHTDGTLTIDGGGFDPGVANYTLDGVGAGDLPIVRLANGATTSLRTSTSSHVVRIGLNHAARFEILSGSDAVFPIDVAENNLSLGSGPGSSGEVIVDGLGSTLTTYLRIVVGARGQGALRVTGGGTVVDTGPPAEPIGLDVGAQGLVEVRGVGSNGTPSTYATNGQLQIGYQGVGTFLIAEGGRANSWAGAAIGVTSSAAGSHATITGPSSRWDVDGVLYVGGEVSAAGGTATLTVSDGAQVTTGSMKVWQPGTVELSHGVLYALSMELAGGTLRGWGNVVLPGVGTLHNAGVVSPDFDIRTIAISGNYVQDPTGTLAIKIGGANQFEYGRLEAVVGTTSLAGRLAVSLIDLAGGTNVFMPAAGNSFDILDWTSRSGTFDALVLPTLAAGLMWNASQLYTAGVLSVFLTGDYNGNGVVDAADYTVWRNSFGQTGIGLAANGDNTGTSAGVIDGADYLAWKSHFGEIAGSGAATSGGVPEPTIIVLGLLCAACLVIRRPTHAPLRIACFQIAAWMTVLPLALIHTPVLADTFGSASPYGEVDHVVPVVSAGEPPCLCPTIVTQPLSQTVTVGSDITFFVEVTGTEPLAFQWNRDSIPIPGATDPSYSILEVQFVDAGDYQAVSTNLCGLVWSDIASLTVNPLPLAGDYNGNGVVDAADYTIWRDTLGSHTDLRANGTDEGASFGVVDLADYQIWKSHFGEIAGSGAAVPESTTVILIAVAIGLALACGGPATSRLRRREPRSFQSFGGEL